MIKYNVVRVRNNFVEHLLRINIFREHSITSYRGSVSYRCNHLTLSSMLYSVFSMTKHTHALILLFNYNYFHHHRQFQFPLIYDQIFYNFH